jgi:hypothetical protein
VGVAVGASVGTPVGGSVAVAGAVVFAGVGVLTGVGVFTAVAVAVAVFVALGDREGDPVIFVPTHPEKIEIKIRSVMIKAVILPADFSIDGASQWNSFHQYIIFPACFQIRTYRFQPEFMVRWSKREIKTDEKQIHKKYHYFHDYSSYHIDASLIGSDGYS